MDETNPLTWKRNDKPLSLFNPLNKDVTFEFRDDDNTPEIVVMRSLQLSTFPTYKANIAKKHLIDAIVNERKLGIVSAEERSEIEKEIQV